MAVVAESSKFQQSLFIFVHIIRFTNQVESPSKHYTKDERNSYIRKCREKYIISCIHMIFFFTENIGNSTTIDYIYGVAIYDRFCECFTITPYTKKGIKSRKQDEEYEDDDLRTL